MFAIAWMSWAFVLQMKTVSLEFFIRYTTSPGHSDSPICRALGCVFVSLSDSATIEKNRKFIRIYSFFQPILEVENGLFLETKLKLVDTRKYGRKRDTLRWLSLHPIGLRPNAGKPTSLWVFGGWDLEEAKLRRGKLPQDSGGVQIRQVGYFLIFTTFWCFPDDLSRDLERWTWYTKVNRGRFTTSWKKDQSIIIY